MGLAHTRTGPGGAVESSGSEVIMLCHPLFVLSASAVLLDQPVSLLGYEALFRWIRAIASSRSLPDSLAKLYNCGTKGGADFGIAPHFGGFLESTSHVIWTSRRGCDFIQSIYKRGGADFDFASISNPTLEPRPISRSRSPLSKRYDTTHPQARNRTLRWWYSPVAGPNQPGQFDRNVELLATSY